MKLEVNQEVTESFANGGVVENVGEREVKYKINNNIDWLVLKPDDILTVDKGWDITFLSEDAVTYISINKL
jgi:hypothetical protein